MTKETNNRYPTAREFFVEVPLYKQIEYSEQDVSFGHSVIYFDGSFDAFCPECNQHSIFERKWLNGQSKTGIKSAWVNKGVSAVWADCSRDNSHQLCFIFDANGNTLQKIGQLPSVAELNLNDVKKYSKVLEKKYFQEFTKAIGLAAHGVGVGSFVYLRRIFELLIEDAHAEATSDGEWNEEAYKTMRMADKINALSSYLPHFLVENKHMYGILSKGVHELDEQECLKSFPIVKIGIEIILDEKLELQRKQQKIKDAKKALSALHSTL